MASGRFFSYAIPEGWRVGEDGQFALTLVSANNKALTRGRLYVALRPAANWHALVPITHVKLEGPLAQWSGYANWLPQVAAQISATNGAAFEMRGVMAQNLRNSTAYAEAARNYRDWSQKNRQAVTDDRNRSVDQRNQGVREVLGNVRPYANPFGDNRNVELPLT